MSNVHPITVSSQAFVTRVPAHFLSRTEIVNVPVTFYRGDTSPQPTTRWLSESALFRRINRALSREDASRIIRCRESSRAFLDLGRYYIVNDRNCATASHCDLEDLAKKMGLLRFGERLAE